MRHHHRTQSLWMSQGAMLNFPSLTENIDTDVVVVGGGITGLTTALLLQKSGREVVLLEGRHLGGGATGRTSAHLTEMLDHRWMNVQKHLGTEKAALLAQGVRDSIRTISSLISEYDIECDFKQVDGYLYAVKEEHLEFLQKECIAATELGFPLEVVSEVGLPFESFGAIRFPKQYYFQPVRYLEDLAREFVKLGGQIFERSHVDEYSDKKAGVEVSVRDYKVRGKELVLATHTPIGFNVVQTELSPYTSYVIAATLKGPVPENLYWDTNDPYFYTRPFHGENETLLIVGGVDHHTGAKVDTDMRFEELENYVRRHYEVDEVKYRWSEEFYYPVDGVPLVGKSPMANHTHIATGYAAEGLTFGTLAAQVLCDSLLGVENKLLDVLSPSRFAALSSPGQFIGENVRNAAKFVSGRFRFAEADEIAAVKPGEGKIVSVNGQKVAVYTDEKGDVHAMSPVCTHMGCHVEWNGAEKTWDCPCHGGRFTAEGEVLEGPPLQCMKAVSLPVEIPRERRPEKVKVKDDTVPGLDFIRGTQPTFSV